MTMNVSVLLLFVVSLVCNIHAQQTPDAGDKDWRLNDVMNIISGDNKEKDKALSDLTERASSEFDKLCHQLEGVLKQVTSTSPFRMSRLDPSSVNKDCKCYCMCPQDTVNSKVMEDIKLKVMDLKERFLNVGKSIKEKIHRMTST